MKCDFCKKEKPTNEFLPSYSPFYPNGVMPFCYECVADKFDIDDLNQANRICQQANAAFFADEWLKLTKRETPVQVLKKYFNKYFDVNYYTYDWSEQNEKIKKLAELGVLEYEIEELRPEIEKELKKFWGDLSTEELLALERSFNSIVGDFNVQSDIQKDMIKKVSKISLIVDKELNQGIVDKDKIGQYQKLADTVMKTLEVNVESKGITSLGQVFDLLERMGFKPNYYDGVPKTEIDLMIQNMQEYTKDLVAGETLIGEQYEQMRTLLTEMEADEDDYYEGE
jgi:hypothetical protein